MAQMHRLSADRIVCAQVEVHASGAVPEVE